MNGVKASNKYNSIWLTLTLAFCQINVLCQKDSLKNLLNGKLHDTLRIEVLFALIDLEEDNKIWPVYNNAANKVIQKHLKQKGKDCKKYISYYGSYLLNKGYLQNQLGDMVNGLKYYKQALRLFDDVKDSSGISIALNNVGYVLQNMAEFKSALEYYKRGYELKKAMKDTSGMGISLSNIASTYEFLKQPLKSVNIYLEAVKLHEAVGNIRGKAIAISNLASNYIDLNRLDTALVLINQSLKIRKQIGNSNDISLSYLIYSQYYRHVNDLQKAYEMALKSYSYAKEYNIPETVKRCAESLYKLCEERGDKINAFNYFKEFISLRDTIFNLYSHRETVRQQLNYEYKKEQLADSLKTMQEKKVMALELSQEKTKRFVLYFGLCFVLLFAAVMVNRFRKTRKQKKIIEEQKAIVDEKQKEVMDSIHYSRRIQQSLLPTEKYIQSSLIRLQKK